MPSLYGQAVDKKEKANPCNVVDGSNGCYWHGCLTDRRMVGLTAYVYAPLLAGMAIGIAGRSVGPVGATDETANVNNNGRSGTDGRTRHRWPTGD